MKVLKILLPILAISLMAAIYIFSDQPADESTEVSNGVGYYLANLFVPGFDQMSEADQLEYVQSMDHTVRKAAHATEYCTLGFLCAASLLVWIRKCRYLSFPIGWGITVLYAVSDELHQVYVPGRACMFTDVLIDAGGAAIGVLILLLIFKIKGLSRRV